MGNRSIRTAVVFSVTVYIIIFISGVLGTIIGITLFHSGLLSMKRIWLVPLIPFVTSIALGTLLSLTIGKKSVRVVERTNNAIQQVAKGNFDVVLNEKTPIVEFREIAQNFNAMTRELAGTEILRNDFVENVSHEFKTPLTAIEGYATLLQQKNLTEEKRIEYTQKILLSTRRLSSLTGNILLLSRLENQEIAVKKECYCLDEQLREIILLLEPSWSSKQLALDIDLADCSCTANRELMAHVWQNIIGNAIKFTPQSGTVNVRLCREANHAVISVSDSGPGMSKEVTARIFEKFYQGDPSRSVSGNGLGLPLAKRIVDLHGGTITVQSLPGQGSAFTVVLPLAE